MSTNGKAPTAKELFDELWTPASSAEPNIRQRGNDGNDVVARGSDDGGKRRQSQATKLVQLCEDGGVELFHSRAGGCYASIYIAGHRETYATKSKSFREYLSRLYYLAEESAAGSQAVRDAITVIDGRARFDGPEIEVYVRVAELDGNIWLDLGDPEWRVVRITRNGWEVLNDSPVRFRRPYGMEALPVPVKVISTAKDELQAFVNVGCDDDLQLILSWLVFAIRGRGPFPILYLLGEQGSCKSTCSRILRKLIDPNKAEIRSTPRDERDLLIAATNGSVVVLDNMSRLDPWLSDAMCRLASGGALATRELYSDDEEVIFEAQRPQLLNGIEELAVKGDFLERSIMVTLPTMMDSARRDEKSFWTDFECTRPRILGALLTAASQAIRDVSSVRMESKPRMADFALWAMAAETALGFDAGSFISAYSINRGQSHDLVLEASVIASPIMKFMDDRQAWEGTTKELLNEITKLVGDDDKKTKEWPKTPRGLGGQLRRVAPALRTRGVMFESLDRSGKSRPIRLSKITLPPSSPSSPSRPESCKALADDGHGDDVRPDERSSSRSSSRTAMKTKSDDDDDGDDGLKHTPDGADGLPLLQEATLENRVKGVL